MHDDTVSSRPVLYLLVGLPASGKTTEARKLEKTRHALRLTADEWMLPLFGHSDSERQRNIVEARLIWIALKALQREVSVVLDLGLWARDERSALVWLSERLGAESSILYLPIDEKTQLGRVTRRFLESPQESFPLSAERLAGFRHYFQIPQETELDGTIRFDPPPGWSTWSEWASNRWPTLPTLEEIREDSQCQTES
ncbi:ATP-binding protein [Arthrobacter sp. 18067]|uniref:AAA family ATPase n=1 Tax=Arthrobacter sp. 18067 TaxID=2681413 RepID=UPI00135AB629